jgi:hypothetical protein
MKARTVKALSQVSKGTIASTGIAILGYAVKSLDSGNYTVGISLALIGVACLTIFVYLIEKQSSDAAIEKIRNQEKLF